MARSEYPWSSNESERVEFKLKWTETAQKTMIAFANTYGGTIYFGVDDNGKPVGVESYDQIERAVFAFARNGVEPDMSSLVHVKPLELADGKMIAVTQILVGDDRPYAMKNKSWTKGGVFVRIGSSSLQASRSEIMGMSKDLIPWEERISRHQDLTFEQAKRICKSRMVPFSPVNYVGYGIADTHGRYTNLGCLISDQNQENIRISLFLGQAGSYSGGQFFSGSILKQREEALEYLNKLNEAHMKKVAGPKERINDTPWPPFAVREALTNCIVHRDFNINLSSSTAVNIFVDRMEFQTIATLPEGLTIEDLYKEGFSFCKNRYLSDFFLRLNWMEKAGSGFTDIFSDYSDSPVKPVCVCTPRIFTIKLPKLFDATNLNEKVIALVATFGSLSARELELKVDCARSTLNKVLKELVDSRQIVKLGAGRSTRYTTPDRLSA